MSESAKALLGGFIFLAAFAILFSWIPDLMPENALVWGLRIGMPVALVLAIVLALYDSFRGDRAPDFLRKYFGRPFERDGVCFTIQPSMREGTLFLNIIFQNQYSARCTFYLVVS